MHQARRDASTVDAITRTIRACFIAVLALIAVIPIADASAQSAPASPVTFLVQGKGWGHGRGLGQWGSLGYALKGWKVDQILAHYYGGTTAGTIDPNSELRVRLLREDDIDVIVVSERGQLVSGAAPGTFTALRAQPQPGGGYRVQSGPGCAGPWTDVTTAPSVDFRTDPAALDSPDPSTLLAVCEVGGVMRYYRGSLLAVRDANGASRAVNILPLDRYLRGVVPRESPASWAGLGGGAGIEAVKAQAVAARSYAWAESRYYVRADLRQRLLPGLRRSRDETRRRRDSAHGGPAHRHGDRGHRRDKSGSTARGRSHAPSSRRQRAGTPQAARSRRCRTKATRCR